MTVAALFVDPNGVYANLPDVEVWDEARDARTYAGPWPVVAHPPCDAWCRLAGMRETRYGYKRGEDGGCFEAALTTVLKYGGVLEHPAYSAAWSEFELPLPLRAGSWVAALDRPGWSCWVDQGWYGHPLKKGTWLYYVGPPPPAMKWGHGPGALLAHHDPSLSSTQREAMTIPTPPAFRDVLLDMARSAALVKLGEASPVTNNAAEDS